MKKIDVSERHKLSKEILSTPTCSRYCSESFICWSMIVWVHWSHMITSTWSMDTGPLVYELHWKKSNSFDGIYGTKKTSTHQKYRFVGRKQYPIRVSFCVNRVYSRNLSKSIYKPGDANPVETKNPKNPKTRKLKTKNKKWNLFLVFCFCFLFPETYD